MGVLFWFLDGLGLAPAGPDNPLTDAPMPTLQHLLGGPLVAGAQAAQPDVVLRAIDATLGVDGLPQSGTGQTALLTGVNVAALHGRHQPAFPPVFSRPLLRDQSLFRMVRDIGGTVAYANVFTEGYWRLLEQRRLRPAAAVLAAQGAELTFRALEDMQRGEAVTWDLSGAFLRGHLAHVPQHHPSEAGRALAHLAATHDLVYFECFLPDLAAHGRIPYSVSDALGLIDTALASLMRYRAADTTVVLTSDHGNCEDLLAGTHTRNPVPLLVIGPACQAFTEVHDIAGVAPAILAAIQHAKGVPL